MSRHFGLHGERFYPEFGPTRTKQSFKDSCDITKMIKKAQKTGSLAHIQKYDKSVYGTFENYDLREAMEKVDFANEIFGALPSEIRREFKGDAIAFAGFASNPANRDRLQELLPAIAEPGDYFPNPVKREAESPVEKQEKTVVEDAGPDPEKKPPEGGE